MVLTDDKPVDISSIFAGLFDSDNHTSIESKAKATTLNEQRNESSREQFERTKAQRDNLLADEFKIRKIVEEEQKKLMGMLTAIVAAAYLGYQYGGWAFFATMSAAWVWQWNAERKAKLKPEYMLGEIDILAEDTVTHERIVALENSNEVWIIVDDKYGPDCGDVFDYPYWSEVNARVRDYRGKSHKERLADNLAARTASLPFRKSKDAHIRSLNSRWELPHWCSIRNNEGGKD